MAPTASTGVRAAGVVPTTAPITVSAGEIDMEQVVPSGPVVTFQTKNPLTPRLSCAASL